MVSIPERGTGGFQPPPYVHAGYSDGSWNDAESLSPVPFATSDVSSASPPAYSATCQTVFQSISLNDPADTHTASTAANAACSTVRTTRSSASRVNDILLLLLLAAFALTRLRRRILHVRLRVDPVLTRQHDAVRDRRGAVLIIVDQLVQRLPRVGLELHGDPSEDHD